MNIPRFLKNDSLIKIIYKISLDVLFLLMIATAVLLIGDAILPGFFSAHFSFVRLTFALFALMAFAAYLSRKVASDNTNNSKSPEKALLFVLSLFLLICVGFVLRILPLWQILINAILILAIFLLLPGLISRDNEK